MAHPPAAQRAHAQGPDVRADGCAGRRGDHVAARDAAAASATGTTATRWIRDSTLALWGLYTLGFDWEANDFFWFIADVAAKSDRLQIMYGVDEESDLSEEVLDHLEGYDGARPVRIGNGAFTQKQHDVWGSVLDSVYIHWQSRDRLDERYGPC